MIEPIHRIGLKAAAAATGISVRTARKWLQRHAVWVRQDWLTVALHRTRTRVDADLRCRIERLRRSRMPMRQIARQVGLSAITVSRVLVAYPR